MQPLISVIVPVYKVEKYLNQCVESIVNQTYSNLEIILVDDGSPDNCPSMCDEWAKRDSRIRVIHKTNGGLSDARNAGMAIATGEYIGFVDSDDWISSDFFEKLYEPCKVYGCDISACDVKFTEDRTVQHVNSESTDYILGTPEDALNDLIRGTGYRAVVWNKLYAAHLLENEAFPVGKYHEDEFFTYRIIAKARKVTYIDQELYYYFQRQDGIVRSVSPKHIDALDAYMERLEYLKDNFPELYKSDKLTICKACAGFCCEALHFPKFDSVQIVNKIKKHRKRIKFKLTECLRFDLKSNIYIFFTRYFLVQFSRIISKRNHSND